MYRQLIVPTEKDHTISLPPHLFGKQVEVVINEVEEISTNLSLPSTLNDPAFWADIPFDPSFPSITEIRNTAWPLR